MRVKEGSDDYRYFPEPDLPPLVLDEVVLAKIREELPELPEQKFQRYIAEAGLNEAEALFLIEERPVAKFFDQVAKESGDARKSSSFVLSILVGRLKKDDLKIEDSKITPSQMAKLIKMLNEGQTSMNIAKGEIFEEMYLNGGEPEQIMEAKGLKSISSADELEKICQQVIAENPKSVQDYLGGKDNAFKALIGQLMKATRGQANPQLANEMLIKLLKQK
jgi:aspartyl-tRNA(Asn)/glutamyl-tRNA(Gln) amidotransferase subunit B